METDISQALVKGFTNSFRMIGRPGKIALCVILAFVLLPVLLRVLSFFRRGGEGV